MIRTCVATEGPDTEPYRIVPTIQPAMGQYDPAGVGGVMRFSEELAEARPLRDLHAQQLLAVVGRLRAVPVVGRRGPIPYPPPTPNGNWDRFQHFSRRLLHEREGGRRLRRVHQLPGAEAGGQPDDHLGAGQRAARHEQRRRVPQVDRRDRAPDQVAGAVAAGDHRQRGADADARRTPGLNVVDDHRSAAIDFICFHMWAANWNWIHKENLAGGLPQGARAREEVHQRARRRRRQGGQADPARGVRLPARRRQLRSRVDR